MSRKLLFPSLLALSVSSHVVAHGDDKQAEIMEEVVVSGVRGRLQKAGLLKDVIERTEIVGSGLIASARAVNLTEAMQDSPGVVIANECSMCGYKRIQLNGLKAEHTNIFNDGLPTHTIVSSFYAVDAIAMTGVERIEVARGAGASMTAPEAIGGVVNVVTVERNENGLTLDLSGGESGFRQAGLLGTLVNTEDTLRLTLIGQYDDRDQADEDHNGVSENPMLLNKSLTARLSWDFSERDNLVLRLSRAEQEVFGGPMLREVTPSISAAINSVSLGEASQLFVGNDVRNDFIGNAWETTEWVASERWEFSASWLRELNARWNMNLSVSGAQHEQDSFYEGFDYVADDEMHYGDLRFNFAPNQAHLLTFGLDTRDESMHSKSRVGAAVNTDGDPATVYVSDSFDYQVRGLYLQDTWAFSDELEVKLALRIDDINADFTDPTKPGVEIDEQIISPRFDAQFTHSDAWTSRFSFGRGYRAPLSFFETDHGILDAAVGFAIEVDKLERSLSGAYTLSYENEALTTTVALSHTKIDHLAALSETVGGVPLLTQLDEKADVTAFDVALGYDLTESLSLSLTAQHYWHNDAFKSSYSVATTEQQVNVSLDWDINGWELFTSVTWIGARDLKEYGYEGYNTASLSEAKTTSAPSFYWFDLKVSRELGENWTVYAGANNLLNQSQAGDEDSPLMYTPDGSYDVAYIYNLLRGRELYAGVKYEF